MTNLYTMTPVEGNAPPLPLPQPTISVVYRGPASSANFTVEGSKFLKNHLVHLRVVHNSTLLNGCFKTLPDADGTIDHEISFRSFPGLAFSFSA